MLWILKIKTDHKSQMKIGNPIALKQKSNHALPTCKKKAKNFDMNLNCQWVNMIEKKC